MICMQSVCKDLLCCEAETSSFKMAKDSGDSIFSISLPSEESNITKARNYVW